MKYTAYRYHFWAAFVSFCVFETTLFVVLVLFMVAWITNDVWLVNWFFGGILIISAASYYLSQLLASKLVEIRCENGCLNISKLQSGIPESETVAIELTSIIKVTTKYNRDDLHTITLHLADKSSFVLRNSNGKGRKRDLIPIVNLLPGASEGTPITRYNTVSLSQFHPSRNIGKYDFFSPETTPTPDKYLLCKVRRFAVWQQMIFYPIATIIVILYSILIFAATPTSGTIVAEAIGSLYFFGGTYFLYILLSQPSDILIFEDRLVIRRQQRYFWQPGGTRTVHFKNLIRFVVTWPSGSTRKKMKMVERTGNTTIIREYSHLSSRTKQQHYYPESYLSKTLHRYIELYQANIKREYWEMDYSSDGD